jgi:hypothetical protein
MQYLMTGFVQAMKQQLRREEKDHSFDKEIGSRSAHSEMEMAIWTVSCANSEMVKKCVTHV